MTARCGSRRGWICGPTPACFNGPVIEPGNAEASYLVELITEGEMPKKEPRLLPGEVRTITDWVNAGAPDN
jgi:hypothetical protein